MPPKSKRNPSARTRNITSNNIFLSPSDSDSEPSASYLATAFDAEPPLYPRPAYSPADTIRDYAYDTARVPDTLHSPPGIAGPRRAGHRPLAAVLDHDEGFVSDVPTSPSPLQLPARSRPQPVDDRKVSAEHSVERGVGHVRSPVLAREPTTLESFSRTLRTYVPAAIPIPSATPSAPRVARPVSFGSFLSPALSPRAQMRDAEAGAWERRGSDPDERWPARGGDLAEDEAVFNLDEEVAQPGREDARLGTRYPGVADSEEIIWAGWDRLAEDCGATARTVLMLGYPSGLQIWDCSNLGSVSEILNLSGPQWGAVEHIGVLPPPVDRGKDHFQAKRPLLGILSRTGERHDLIVYSLRTHEIIKKLSFPGLTSFLVSPQFIVLSTSHPHNLHVLSSCTFATLYTVSSSALAPYASQPVKHNPNINSNNNVSTLAIDEDPRRLRRRLDAIPHPVFAISHRLLAFASPFNLHDGPAHADTTSQNPDAARTLLGMSQAEFGTAAVKLGGSVLSGMKSLGGMAFSAARARVNAAVAGEQAPALQNPPSPAGAALGGLFFSKSAPADSGRRASVSTSAAGGWRDRASEEPLRAPMPAPAPATGCNITVLDLQPLLGPAPAQPAKVAEFVVSGREPASQLVFSADGASLAAALKEGHGARVFQLRPLPHAMRLPADGPRGHARDGQGSTAQRELGAPEAALLEPSHVYSLRRGRTAASVEGLQWAHDGRFFALSTRKRTVHVFAVNPYGGRPDDASHLLGRVVNALEPQPQPTDLSPLVRLRTAKIPPPELVPAPIAFTFVRPSQVALPPALLPPVTMHYSTSSSPSSVSSTSRSNPVSPAQRAHRPTNYQDVLKFDPFDGTLALCRITLDRSAGDAPGAIPSAVPIVGGTSLSFPGISSVGRMSASPASSHNSPRGASGFSQVMERAPELVAREAQVGTWNLCRGRAWPEIRYALGGSSQATLPRLSKSDWLSHAELSTSSTSSRILPRTIYLSHQFSFHAFGEDYHALIRSQHFDVPSTKVEVRREVEVSAYSTDTGESFVQGLSTPRDIGRVSSSFDEPLASALSATMHTATPSSPIPMYPNGAPGAAARSLKGAVPIRSVAAGLTDTMSDSLVRLRREVRRARARRSQPENELLVPLEFAEEDEDFFADGARDARGEEEAGALSRSVSRGGDSGESVSTPSTNFEALPAEGDGGDPAWQGWEIEDQQAVEDAERFDDISVGFMDEEQAELREATMRRARKVRAGKK